MEGGDGAEQTVLLLGGAGTEQQGVVVAGHAVPELQCPEAVDPDRLAGGVAQTTQQSAGEPVVRVDPSVTEVADEQRTRELPEPPRAQPRGPMVS